MAPDGYQYALWQVIPDLQRAETLNVGLVLFCRTRRFLQARVGVPAARLAALAPELDPRALQNQLEAMQSIAAGDPRAGALAELPPSERFHWLVAPASTLVQPGPVHTGLMPVAEPAELLDRLFARLVA